MTTMLVFIDESGDSGFKFGRGSSTYFVVTAVIFGSNFNADACDRSIEELRRTLRVSPFYEFHFAESPDSIRERFLCRAVTERFAYHAFVLNKRKLYGEMFQDATTFYNFAVSIVCENARPLLVDAKVVIDKCGDRAFKRQLEKHLKQKMTDEDGTCRIRKVGMEASHTNNLVQLADMICGAVARSFNAEGAAAWRFRRLIQSREKRVQLWPKK